MRTMLSRMLTEAADNCGVRTQAYSGRGMFGKDCVGLSGTMPECMTVVKAVINTVATEHGIDYLCEALEILLHFKQDSMGLGTVIYWPSVPYIYGEDETECQSNRAPCTACGIQFCNGECMGE